MAFDALAELRNAGNPVDELPAAQREVLASLGATEVTILNEIRRRLAAAPESEVVAHGPMPAGSTLF